MHCVDVSAFVSGQLLPRITCVSSGLAVTATNYNISASMTPICVGGLVHELNHPLHVEYRSPQPLVKLQINPAKSGFCDST